MQRRKPTRVPVRVLEERFKNSKKMADISTIANISLSPGSIPLPPSPSDTVTEETTPKRRLNSLPTPTTAITALIRTRNEAVFEGEGRTKPGTMESTDSFHPDPLMLVDEISTLRHQNKLMSLEIEEFKTQLLAAEDSCFQLSAQKENLRDKAYCYKEKLDKLQDGVARDLEDTKQALSSSEDTNYLLNCRLKRVEKDLMDAVAQRDTAKTECIAAKSDSSTCRLQIRKLESELSEQDELNDRIRKLESEKTQKADEIKGLKQTVEELKTSLDSLRREKSDLEKHYENEIEGLESLSFSLNSSNLSSGPESNEGISAVQCPYSFYGNNSLHAEIAASLAQDEFSSIENYTAKSVASIAVQTLPRAESNLRCSISKVDLNELFIQICKMLETTGKSRAGLSLEECGAISGEGDVTEMDLVQDEVVRRINEELSEFREQLKKSQELFHAMQTNSSQNVCVTQSCPLLADNDSGKPKLVTCSTQTEMFTVMPSAKSGGSISSLPFSSPMPPDGMEDSELTNLFENMSIDDAGSYRLAINLSTVVEETSDQETETSPTSLQRSMSGSKRRNPRLKEFRMPNTMEEEHENVDLNDIKSDNEYMSAASSLPNSGSTSNYGSLERPLVCGLPITNGGANGKEDDTCSSVSSQFCSPISSPSSMAYWTPLEGSSSQDTITIPDGDKTPVNDELPQDDSNSDISPDSKPRNWGSEVLTDNRENNSSIGVIPDADLDRMQEYAYNPVARNTDHDAKVLTSKEWRELKSDLHKKEMDQFKKQNRQEDGGDTEGEAGYARGSSNLDLDEEAEEYCEIFPELVKQLFSSLDDLKPDAKPSETELNSYSVQFEQLSTVFKTNHINLAIRSKMVAEKHEYSKQRMMEINLSWKENLRKLREQKSGDLHEILSAMEDSALELENHSTTLARTARKAGMMDYDVRTYKMIEVMLLYVHIMKKLRENEEEERILARKLLSDHQIPFPSKKALGTVQNNNNNNEKVPLHDGLLGEGHADSTERFEDGTPKHLLQYLLATKTNRELPQNPQEIFQPKGPGQHFILKYVHETYEVWRREFHWPWNWDQTWKGIKQGFSVFVMIIGILIIVGNVIPNVGADGECETMMTRFFSLFAEYGYLTHTQVPHF